MHNILLQDLKKPLHVTKEGTCGVGKNITEETVTFATKTGIWHRAGSLQEVHRLLEKHKADRTRLVVGNTGNG